MKHGHFLIPMSSGRPLCTMPFLELWQGSLDNAGRVSSRARPTASVPYVSLRGGETLDTRSAYACRALFEGGDFVMLIPMPALVAVASHHQQNEGAGAALQGFNKATGLRHRNWPFWAMCGCSTKNYAET